MLSNITQVSVSFPRELVEKIDNDRGLIPRSRFLATLVEKAYNKNKASEATS